MPPLTSNLLSCDDLQKILTDPDVSILDASQIPLGDNTHRTSIQGAVHFDFSHVICDENSGLPNTMPSPQKFADELCNLGVKMTDFIVIYDNKGIYSAPRVWWMFKTMGYNNVAVLDGGLPLWMELGYPCDQGFAKMGKSQFQTSYQDHLICGKDKIKSVIKNQDICLLDARSNSRFLGEEAETRPGLRSGHIPTSINLHFRSLVPQYNMLPQEELTEIFKKIVPNLEDPIIFTCGSGVTACILALAATICGYKDLCVYDGSWTEWGADESLPIGIG